MTINRNILTGVVAIVASLWLGTAATAEVVSPQAVGCKLIRNAAQLQAMQDNRAGSYCLANDIDASSVANFVPIGDEVTPFTGRLFDNGRVIRNLTIDGGQYVGLFGAAAYGALIQDVGLVNVDIVTTATGASVGGLVGYILGNGNAPTEIGRASRAIGSTPSCRSASATSRSMRRAQPTPMPHRSRRYTR